VNDPHEKSYKRDIQIGKRPRKKNLKIAELVSGASNEFRHIIHAHFDRVTHALAIQHLYGKATFKMIPCTHTKTLSVRKRAIRMN